MQTVRYMITRQRGRFKNSLITQSKFVSACILKSILFLILSGVSAVNAKVADQYLLTPPTYKSLSVIHELLDKQQYVSAVVQLKALQNRVKGTSKTKAYEQAVVLQTLGYTYASMEDYPKAIQAFEASLNLDSLPVQVVRDVRYSLAQLYMATEQYAKAAQLLEIWLKESESPRAEAHVLAASAYYYLEQYNQTVPHIIAAIDLAKDPQESWYQLHLAARLELRQYNDAAQVLGTLIGLFPEKEQYWQQLATIYMEMSKEQQALAVQALTAHVRQLKDKELIRLADFYRYLNVPYKAAQILDQGLKIHTIEVSAKNWENLANAWLAAREWEKAAYAFSESGKLRKDGTMDIRRGQLFIQLQQWDKAGAAFEQALSKGGLDDLAQARLLLGQIRYEQGRFTDAVKALELAKESPNYSKQAAQWLKHLQMVQKQKAIDKG